MLSNITSCYRECFTPNESFYVEVRNNCPFYLYIAIEYTINEILFKKQSPVFPPSKFQRLVFPSGSLFLQLKVFNCAPVPPTLIRAKYIKTYISTCHVVTGYSSSTFSCVEVPC